MSPAPTYMRSTDAFSWYMERDASLRSTVVAVFWLDATPDWEVLVDRVDRMSRLMPSMRQQVVEAPLRLTTPRWIFDPHFDLAWHLRRVAAPAPGSRDTVLEVARQAAMDSFDKQRPMWELTLIEGLADGGAGVVFKLHHSMSDGVGAMAMLTVIFDLDREPADLGPMPPEPVGEDLDRRDLLSGALESAAGSLGHRTRRVLGAAGPTLVRSVLHPLATVRGATAMAASVYRLAAPIPDTLSPVMVERAMTRHLDTMEVALKDLKKASRKAGVTLNDAYLAAVTGALHRYHERHGTSVESLRAVMPVNLRAEQETEWGNLISLQRIRLPVDETDPVARMQAVRQVTDAARDEPSLPYTDLVAEGLNLLPTSYVGSVLKHIDFLASNVPGTPIPIFLAGARVSGFFAFGPTIGTAFNITLISHQETCNLGINIDTTSVPDPEILLECLRDSFAEILDVGR